jgi:hypothetical protein
LLDARVHTRAEYRVDCNNLISADEESIFLLSSLYKVCLDVVAFKTSISQIKFFGVINNTRRIAVYVIYNTFYFHHMFHH